MERTRVLMLFGGESSEHDVSISSARNVYAAINDDAFDVYPCYIDRSGKWWLLDAFDAQIDLQDAQQLLPMMGNKGFVTISGNRSIGIDVILPILHGRNGEDGTVQGLAQLLHIPIVGCDVTASAIAMNKLATKEILQANSIKVTPHKIHRIYDEIPDFDKLVMTLGSPVFVKPARSGSSVGVSKVYSSTEFVTALDEAHRHDSIVLIEQAISGRELEVAVLGTPPHHKVSGVGEVIPGADFYNYDDKYSSESTASINVTPELSNEIAERIQQIAKTAYEILDCKGLARIDFLMDDSDIYLLEVNTMPGFTNISMYPKLWRQQGIGYPELIEQLIKDAISHK